MRFLSHKHRRQSWEVGGSRPPDFGQGVVGVAVGLQRGGAGGSLGRGRVVKYYYILLCTGSLFESGDF